MINIFCSKNGTGPDANSNPIFDYSDTLALREILDANGLTNISAASPSIVTMTLVGGNVHRIKELSLVNKGLSVIPARIKDLTAMQVLRLDSNSISSLPEEIGRCTSLVRLQVSNNNLSALPTGIGNLKSLTILVLSNNQIATLPSSLWNLTSLSVLLLDKNNLTEISSQISSLVNLTRLALNNNSLSTLPESLMSINLQMLEINNNRICPSSLNPTFAGWIDNRAEQDWRTTQIGCQ